MPTASRNASNSLASTGNRPQNTTGCADLNPASGASAGFFSSVTVSPTRVSATWRIEAVKKPISPGPSEGRISCFGRKMPTRSIW